MVSPETWLSYKLKRLDPTVRASHAIQWTRNEQREKRTQIIKILPYTDKDERVIVPGIGTLTFQLKPDQDTNPNDRDEGVAWQWVKYNAYDAMSVKRSIHVGAQVMDNCYSTGEIDRGSVLCLRFNKKCGSRLEDRIEYWRGIGYARHEAWLRARQSITAECERAAKICKGDIGYYGGVVKLHNLWGKELGEESCWGFEVPDDDYLLGEMNGWAHSLVAEEWKKRYDCDPPDTYTRGVDSRVDAAWQAWHTAMTVSDGDRDMADPIFVSTFRGDNELRTRGIVQVQRAAA